MDSPSATAKTVFLEALEIASASERQALLDARCGPDAELRREVDELLAHHGKVSGFLETLPTAVADLADTAREAHATTAPSLSFLLPSQRSGSLGRLGHYEILDIIGSGGFGVVLKAHDEKLQRVVAIKSLAESLAASATARKRFVREAQNAAAVRHDNVVGIFAVEEAGPVPYLVMELVDGISLEDKLQREGPLELKEVLRIGMQIAAGLAAAHKQGLVHRDVKPANILLENGIQRVKITDFGLARGVDDASLTQTGLIAGTPSYMSPEQARGERLDARSDLFSLGSVLYVLCTGRVPFTAGSSLGVAKKVCEETPQPIAQLNPAIPPWLSEIVERLHAKDPAQRFQSAEEVAELFGKYLAHVQQASMGLATSMTAHRATPAQESLRRWQPLPGVRRGLMVLAVALVLMGAMLGFTEAQGVTHLAATIIRILTPEGTLVVEVEDPAVKVTVEGDGGLVITGAGLHEVHLKPGKYQLHADKDGQQVPLSQDLVTITRGDKQVVRVRLETKTASAAPAPEAAAAPFVVFSAAGKELGKYHTLVEAVLRSSDGDTIEIHGNGPFPSGTVRVTTRLMIRAGQGFRPVISFDVATFVQGRPRHLLDIRAPLVLEGLEFHGDELPITPVTMSCYGVPLHIANCRFIKCQLMMQSAPAGQVRNSQFSTTNNYAIYSSQGSALTLDNNIVASGIGVPIHLIFPEDARRMEITRNAFTSGGSGTSSAGVFISFQSGRPAQTAVPAPLYVSRNIVSGPGGILCSILLPSSQAAEPPPLSATALEALPRERLAWHEEHNLYSTGTPLLKLGQGRTMTSVAPATPRTTLAEWDQFWGQSDTGSIQGEARFQGGAAVHSTPCSLVPDDFRLRSDSAGYRAGPDGKDLGPDIDLVGPGDAYERWKKTPAYAEWQRSIAQSFAAKPAVAMPAPQSQPFVILGRNGQAEQKLATLAEAVQKSASGDTIEIRGDGPFVTAPIQLSSRRTIRAGKEFRPVFTMDAANAKATRVATLLETHAPLVVEGVEFHGAVEAKEIQEIAINCVGAPLYLANCRFSQCMVGVASHPACELRNSQFSNTRSYAIRCSTGSAVVLDNNIVATSGSYLIPLALLWPDNVQRVELTRNVFTAESAKIGIFLTSPFGGQTTGPTAWRLSHNILSGSGSVLCCNQSRAQANSPPLPLKAAELESLLRERTSWHEQQNLHSTGTPLLSLSSTQSGPIIPIEPAQPLNTLGQWNQFWGQSETGSIEGVARFQGGDAVYSTPDMLGPDDFRLRPDSAGYRAGPDGKDLGPDIDLVGPGDAYERWKQTPAYQQWLKDSGQLVAGTSQPQAGAFVILSRGPAAERTYDTLAEAAEKSTAGDTIEIRGNGPFVTGTISIARLLTIRAGQGFRPVISFDAATLVQGRPRLLLDVYAPLVLEGLEFQGDALRTSPISINSIDVPVYVANCRMSGCLLQVQKSPACQLRNSQFSPAHTYAVICSGCAAKLDNNIVATGGGTPLHLAVNDHRTDLTRNVFTTGMRDPLSAGIVVTFSEPHPAQNSSREPLHLSHNIVSGPASILRANVGPNPLTSTSPRPVEAAELEHLPRERLAWHEEQNLYSTGTPLLSLSRFQDRTTTTLEPTQPLTTLAEWNQFWGQTDSGSLQGAVRFQGGDAVYTMPHTLEPDAFRLKSDSAGYRAGPDGKDLGPDIDLVGPGEAYERWKKTPDYQQWLKDIGQLSTNVPPSQLGAFVVLGGEGVAEQKLDTLAEAVQRSSDGDTIEIRGNGPFETPQLSISSALTIRAGAGYRPIISAAPDVASLRPPHFVVARKPLTLEGLEFQGPAAGGSDCMLIVQDAPCYVANCQFRRCSLTASRALGYQVRNSYFSIALNASLLVHSNVPESVQIVENNLLTTSLSGSFGRGARVDVRHNLIMGPQFSIAAAGSNRSGEPLPAVLHASQNIIIGSPVLRFSEAASTPYRTTAASGAELESTLRSVINWREDQNLYAEGTKFLALQCATRQASKSGFVFGPVEPTRPYNTLTEWNEFWGQSNTGAVQGRVQFQGGDAVYSTPHTLGPDDFRLREGSAGYRAGPDGKDLGPDIDLVGPGEAYERWKKTPEYQKWLEETEQKK